MSSQRIHHHLPGRSLNSTSEIRTCVPLAHIIALDLWNDDGPERQEDHDYDHNHIILLIDASFKEDSIRVAECINARFDAVHFGVLSFHHNLSNLQPSPLASSLLPLTPDLISVSTVNSVLISGIQGVLNLQMYTFPRPDLLLGIILHGCHVKKLTGHLHKLHVRSSSFFEAEITDRICAYHFTHRLQQEWKRRFKVYAISCQKDVRRRRNRTGNKRPPFEYLSCDWCSGRI